MNRSKPGYTLLFASALLAAGCGLGKQRAFERGVKLYEKGQYDEASLEFRRAIQKDANFGEAYLKLGLTEEKQGHPLGAIEALKHALALMPERAEPKAELAQLFINAYLAEPQKLPGFYQQASAFTTELLNKDPNSFYGLRLKGYLAVADNKPQAAIEAFQRANQVKPEQADVVSMLVQNLFRDGQSGAGESLASHFLASHKQDGPLYDLLYAHFMESRMPAEGERVLKEKVAGNPNNSFYVTQLCRHYWNTGRREEAASCLHPIIDEEAQFPSGHLDAGNFFAENRDWSAASREYEAGIRLNPKSKTAYQKRLATVLLAAGERDEAEKTLDEILKDHPDDDDARASRAALRVANGTPQDLDQAIADFKVLAEKQPRHLQFAYQLGRAYELKGSDEAAKAQYLAILRLNNSDVSTLDALSHLYLRERRFADARKYSDAWLEVDPKNPSARLVRSASLAGLGERQQTRAVLTSLIQDFPKLEGAYLQLALLDVMEKRYDEAEALFRKHYRPGQGDLGLLKGMVEVYAARKQWEKARAAVEKELEVSPRSVELHSPLAETASRAGEYDLAIQEYQKLQQQAPGTADIPLQLGLLYEAKRQYGEAVLQFQAAHRMNPKDSLAPAMLGRALEEIGRGPEAIAAYRDCLQVDPGNASVLNNLAFALAEAGDSSEAVRTAQRAVQKSPNNLDFTDTLGWAYLKNKDIASAVQIFQSLRQREPRNVSFRVHLARALFEQGDANAAKKELLAAQELHPTGSEQSEIRELLSRM